MLLSRFHSFWLDSSSKSSGEEIAWWVHLGLPLAPSMATRSRVSCKEHWAPLQPYKYKGEGQPLNRGDSWELMRTTTPTSKEQVQLQWFLTQRQDFPSGSDGKASAYTMGDPGSFPGLGRSQAEGNGNPLQYSCLENPMDRGAWEATVHGVAKSRTQLSDFTLTLNFQNTCEASTSNSQNHSRELHSRHHTPANTNM